MTLTRFAALLPLVTFLLLWGLIAVHRGRLAMGRLSARGAMVLSFVVFEVVVVAITEVLSVGHHLTRGVVSAAWVLVTVAVGLGLHVSGGTERARRWWRGGGPRRGWRAASHPPAVALGVVVLLVIGAVLITAGLTYLPNNPDSLVYHLARVASWAQDASVAHFATHYTAQVELAPLHEFNMLHLHLLADTDALDGMVQLLSFVICVVGAGEVARLLGGRREVQLAAAVIAAVVPSALLEATSTQNNLFAAAIGVALIVIVLAWEPLGPLVPPALLLGATAGLAVLAKGTTLPMLGPAVLLLGARIAMREAHESSWGTVARRALGTAAIGAVVALVIVGPFLKRNIDLFDTPGGPITRVTMNREVSAKGSAANVVRSVAIQIRTGDGGSGLDSMASRAMLHALREVDDWTGARANAPAFTIGNPVDLYRPDDFSAFARNEDYGANPWHVVLMVFAGGFLVVRVARGDPRAGAALLLAVGLAGGFILFTATTRWSVFAVRYQLPLLVLWAPIIAIALAGVHRVLLWAVAAMLVIASGPALLDNSARPMLDRRDFHSDLEPYFAPRLSDGIPTAPPEDYEALLDALVATGCDRVAFGNWILFEYPVWVGLEDAGWDGELRHVDVSNESRMLEKPGFEPCATIRQTFLNPPLEPIPGQQEFAFGDLRLAVDDELVDRLPTDVVSEPVSAVTMRSS